MKFPARQRVIAAAIAQAREEAGLSKREASRRLGVPENWFQRVESLERAIYLHELPAIAKVIGIDPEVLFRRCLR